MAAGTATVQEDAPMRTPVSRRQALTSAASAALALTAAPALMTPVLAAVESPATI